MNPTDTTPGPASPDLERWSAKLPSAPTPAPAPWIPVRRLAAADLPALREHLLSLNEEDRYLRFGHAVGDEQIVAYVDQLDLERDEVLGIFNRRLELLGAAHLAFMDRGRAEFGVSVRSHARGRGYGHLLFEHAMLHARNRGVRILLLHTLTENGAMMKIARRAGARIVQEAGEATARLALPSDDWGSQVHQFVDEQAAEIDYRLKAVARLCTSYDEG